MLNYPMTFAAQQIYDAYEKNERSRLDAYKLAWEAYNGILPNSLKTKPGAINDNIRASKCRTIVDTSVSYLFGQNIEFELDKLRTRTPEEKWLDECWRVNRKMTLLGKLGTNGAVCGHVFIKLIPEHPSTAPFPRLIVLDPANVRVRWDDDDIEQVNSYRIQWKAIDGTTGKPVTKRQDIERQGNRWLISDYERQETQLSSQWRLIRREVWPYTWPPVIDCQNIPVPNEFYGESDIPLDVINLNKSRNFTLSNWARIIKHQAHQIRWGRGFRADELVLDPDGVFIIDSETGVIDALPAISEMTGIDTFDRRLDEAIHEASRTPAIVTGKLESVGPLSGVALQILYGPLVQKTEGKRRSYGDMLSELCRRLLELEGYGPSNTVSIVWPEIVPQDMVSERQSLVIDASLGVVSKGTLATKLGYDWEAEQKGMEQEAGEGEPDKSAIPSEDEGTRMKVAFEALKAAVDAGLPLEVLLEKYLGWTPAEVQAVTQEQEAEEEANALEARERMNAMREGGIIGQQQQPGQTEASPRPFGQPANSGGTSAARGDGRDA